MSRLTRSLRPRIAAVAMAGLMMSTGLPARATASTGIVGVRCADVTGLVRAVANEKNAVINLNTDHVVGCTYSLTTAYARTQDGLPPIARTLSVNGSGATISRSSSSTSFRILEVGVRGDLHLTSVGIRGGSVPGLGGGLLNGGRASLTHATVSGNAADEGAGIFNSGSLTLTGSTVSDNTAGSEGGGVYNVGVLESTDSTVGRNTVGSGGSLSLGGGISNYGVLSMTSSAVTGNTSVSVGSIADSRGGGIINEEGGELALMNCSITDNTADEGGGIFNNYLSGGLRVHGGTIDGNTARYSGGGIENGSPLTLSDATIKGNTARYGGGIENLSALTLTGSIVRGNTARVRGGGIDNVALDDGVLTAINTAFTGNTTSGRGGALYNDGGTAALTGGRIANDRASAGGGIYNRYGIVTAAAVNFSGNRPANCEGPVPTVGCSS